MKVSVLINLILKITPLSDKFHGAMQNVTVLQKH